MISRRPLIACSLYSIAVRDRCSQRFGVGARCAGLSAILSALSSCSVSSCKSRAQRARSRSDESMLRRRSVCAATSWAVATAVAALAAKASMSASSSLENAGPSLEPVERLEHAHRAAVEDERDDQPGLRVDPSPRGRNAGATTHRAMRSGPAGTQDGSARRVGDARRVPMSAPSTWPATAVMTRSSPSLSRITMPRASTSARPRFTISSSTRSRCVSPPIARAISVVASSPRTRALELVRGVRAHCGRGVRCRLRSRPSRPVRGWLPRPLRRTRPVPCR